MVLFDHCRHNHDGHSRAAVRGSYVRQIAVIGHTRHLGFRATHTMAPRSINAWLKSKIRLRGTSASETAHRCFRVECALASPRPTKTRNSTRATLVSRMAARWPNAKLRMAPAV